jgi:hypothetical protein
MESLILMRVHLDLIVLWVAGRVCVVFVDDWFLPMKVEREESAVQEDVQVLPIRLIRGQRAVTDIPLVTTDPGAPAYRRSPPNDGDVKAPWVFG